MIGKLWTNRSTLVSDRMSYRHIRWFAIYGGDKAELWIYNYVGLFYLVGMMNYGHIAYISLLYLIGMMSCGRARCIGLLYALGTMRY